MQTARRLYVYLLSGIGLGVLVAGVSLLLGTLLEALGLDGGQVLAGEQATRERLTLATAMTAVSLPVWLIHWFLAQRAVQPGRPEADLERSSGVRGLYIALVLGALLLAAFLSLRSLVENTVLALAGESTFNVPASEIALAISAGLAWLYHLRVRLGDWRHGPITDAGAWLPRAYLFIATFVGLMVMLFGLADLLGLVARLLAGGSAVSIAGNGGPWWSYPLASDLSRVLVGGATWLGHVWYARRLWSDRSYRGAVERPAALRFAFYVAVLVVSAAAAIGFTGQIGRVLIGAALGLPVVDGSSGGLLADLLAAALAGALFAATWMVHGMELRRAAVESAVAARVSRPDRLISYPAALVGLAIGAGAAARLIGVVVDLVLGAGRVLAGGESSERAFADFAPYAVLGLGVWLWHWSAIMRTVAADPASEAESTVRRSALLFILAASVLAGIASLGVILYRLFGTLFGLDAPASVVSELSAPIGVLIVSVAVAVYHGRLLRRDGELRAEVAPEQQETAAVARPWVPLTLVGPAGAEPGTLSGVADGLRAQLPEGFELRDEGRMT